jgi:Ca2+-binding RTX toxin-like protein
MAIIKGNKWIDWLSGTDSHDFIYGYGASDLIWAGDGNDYVEGGDGADFMDGGDGEDTLSYIDYQPQKYAVPLGVHVSLTSGTGGPGWEDTFSNFENIAGSNYSDHLWGDSGENWLLGWDDNDFLYGEGGDDHLLGLDADDELTGGGGADQLDGGAGIDTAYYNSSSAGVHVSLLNGKGYYGDAAGDTFYEIENITGSDHDDELWGDDKDNVLYGGDGKDLLKGGGGADTLVGSGGDDTAYYSDSPEYVYVKLDGINGFGSNGTAEGDKLAWIANVNGSDYDDTLEGDWEDNTLKGGKGDDDLQGHGGADTLDGGKGVDTAQYVDSDTGVVVALLTSSEGGRGYAGDAEGDTLISIENVVGSSKADTLWGNDDANVLDGRSGNDELKGAGGADTLVGGLGADNVTGGAGADVFVWTKIAETGLTTSTIDFVEDFDFSEGDKIDLSQIDANTTVSGDQEFTFVGAADFSAPGQIKYFNDGTDTFISLNTDSNPLDDAAIRVSGLQAPDALWFVF